MKNKPVVQEDFMGCAIACVAFILNKTYKESILLFRNQEKRINKGFTVKEIVDALQKSGNNYHSRYVGRLENIVIKNDTIVYVKKCQEFPRGHYLVKIKNGYMDPFINLQEKGIMCALAGFRKIVPGKIVLVVELDK